MLRFGCGFYVRRGEAHLLEVRFTRSVCCDRPDSPRPLARVNQPFLLSSWRYSPKRLWPCAVLADVSEPRERRA